MDWTWIIIKRITHVVYQIKHSEASKSVRINTDNLKRYAGSKTFTGVNNDNDDEEFDDTSLLLSKQIDHTVGKHHGETTEQKSARNIV